MAQADNDDNTSWILLQDVVRRIEATYGGSGSMIARQLLDLMWQMKIDACGRPRVGAPLQPIGFEFWRVAVRGRRSIYKWRESWAHNGITVISIMLNEEHLAAQFPDVSFGDDEPEEEVQDAAADADKGTPDGATLSLEREIAAKVFPPDGRPPGDMKTGKALVLLHAEYQARKIKPKERDTLCRSIGRRK